MKIVVISVGKIKKDYAKAGAAEYLKRLKRYSPIEFIETKEEPAAKTPYSLEKEAEKIIKNIQEGDFIAALSDKGKQYTSKGFADFINTIASKGTRRLCFIVGGAYGLHSSIIEGADLTLSLSQMTLPHDMARLVLLEQIYRAFTILRNEPYSH